MRIYALFVALLILGNHSESQTTWNGTVTDCAFVFGEQYLLLPTGFYGKMGMDDNGNRTVRLSDGSYRREKDHDQKAGAFRVTARMTGAKVLVPSEPKMSTLAIKSGVGTERHQQEGVAKVRCMMRNSQYDHKNVEPKHDGKGTDYTFNRQGEARRRYGRECVMFAV